MRSNIPEIIAALAFFGAIFICPLVYLMMRHQRTIAELIHRNAAGEAFQRLEALEREMRELKAQQYDQLLARDDQK
jgi:hypothetical protein